MTIVEENIQAAAVKQVLHRTVLVKRELSRKAKLSIYWSI